MWHTNMSILRENPPIIGYAMGMFVLYVHVSTNTYMKARSQGPDKHMYIHVIFYFELWP